MMLYTMKERMEVRVDGHKARLGVEKVIYSKSIHDGRES